LEDHQIIPEPLTRRQLTFWGVSGSIRISEPISEKLERQRKCPRRIWLLQHN